MKQGRIEQQASYKEDQDQPPLLDRIRQAEADVVRAVALARERAQQIVAEAQEHTQSIAQQAQETGRRAGEKEYEAIIAAAHAEAEELRKRAQQQAETLRAQTNDHRISAAVQAIVDLILERKDKTCEA